MDRIKLYDEEIEKSVLSSIMKQEELFIELEVYKEELFYSTENQNIFKTMKELKKENKAIDLLTVSKRANAKFKTSITYVSAIYSENISTVNFETYLEILVEYMNKRKVFNVIYAIDFKTKMEDIQECLDKVLQETMTQITEKNTKESVLEFVENVNNPCQNIGIKTGLTKLDQRIGGIRTGITTIAGYTSMGKSVLAVQLMLNMLRQNKKIDYFSIEMTKEEIFNRMSSNACDIDYSKIYLGKTNEKEKQKITEFAARFLLAKDFEIYDAYSDINKIINIINKDKMKRDIDIVFIDLINRVEDYNYRDNNRANFMSHISRKLKVLSQKLDIPIVITAQINRAVEQRQDKMPTLADIKESGGIAEDSDLVMILYRNKELDKEEVREKLHNEGKLNYNSRLAEVNPECININLAKGRNLKTFIGAFYWKGEYQRIGNMIQ